jgi:hypothetical protein
MRLPTPVKVHSVVPGTLELDPAITDMVEVRHAALAGDDGTLAWNLSVWQVRNQSDRTLHLNYFWESFDQEGRSRGESRSTHPDLQPGQVDSGWTPGWGAHGLGNSPARYTLIVSSGE